MLDYIHTVKGFRATMKMHLLQQLNWDHLIFLFLFFFYFLLNYNILELLSQIIMIFFSS